VQAVKPGTRPAPILGKSEATRAGVPPTAALNSNAGTIPARAGAAAGGYGIAVGTFILEDRATSERDRLSGVTGMPGIVAPTTDGGTTAYRVILSQYPTRDQAEERAATLVSLNLVPEAQVMPLPDRG
jgi:hypothetical protein